VPIKIVTKDTKKNTVKRINAETERCREKIQVYNSNKGLATKAPRTPREKRT